MPDDNIKRRPPWWMRVLVGAFVGGFFGFVVGSGTTFAFCLVSVLMGLNPPIIVVVIYAIFGAVIFTLAGAFLGAIWPLLRGKRRLTIAQRLLLTAVIGLSLPLFLAHPEVGLLLLVNTLLVLPTVIVALVAADRYTARSVDPQKTNA